MTKTIVLVHGAFADSRSFDAVRPLLEARGYRVVAPDLPGHGTRATSAAIDLASYVAAVSEIVEAQGGEVVLVGHSMAGMVVSQVAEDLPSRIAKLVYVAAYLPVTGQSLQQLAETDGASLVGKNMVFAPDYSTVTIKTDALRDAICADVPAVIQDLIVAHHEPEPLPPFQGTVTLTPERFGRVAKAYLQTTEDRAVTLDLQRRMLAHYPTMVTDSIATSHLPFVSRPAEFVAKLERLIA